MMGKTRGKTTEASARYSYKTRISFSSVVYLTNVANTVNTRAWVGKLVKISGSKRQFDSPETDPRSGRRVQLAGGVGVVVPALLFAVVQATVLLELGD